MKKKHNAKRKAQKLFSLILFTSWISFMAFAGFFAPSFLAQLPFFKVKQIELNGNEKISFEEIKSIVEELSTNLVKLNEENITDALNARFKNRVKRVYMTKSLGLDGMRIKVKVVERKPVAKLKFGQNYLLIDKEGSLFPPLEGEDKGLIEIQAYDMDLLKAHFEKLYSEVISMNLPIKHIYIRRDSVILNLVSKQIILPPLELLPDNISGRLKMIYNFQEETVDLRYGRFILVRN
ncbi:POTRA domain-containing FtsQ-type protein [Hydrogenivirga caldilitoris]|uniref:POTRA domain-containing FtsQ-type protein n=1 Tax=Hydrogenivirga caldilitoris TaxID=246264 RepID=A0A497XQ27_9AQUI|nr:FtsQ-type POTRA domain-containing protein [Hydrogenivirga caldilitoris]RLJ70354.1 POTRA domain-containing FtsQ-type protein [Hydrogenivirga caldilitoris]